MSVIRDLIIPVVITLSYMIMTWKGNNSNFILLCFSKIDVFEGLRLYDAVIRIGSKSVLTENCTSIQIFCKIYFCVHSSTIFVSHENEALIYDILKSVKHPKLL